MAITINTNVMSLNAQRNLGKSQGSLANSMQRLSSGLRINSAKDDAAGLAISDRMTAQIRGLNQAARNANDGISLAQTAEGALQESTNLLQRMRELAVQSANDTNSDTDRDSLNAEVTQLKAELDRIAETTEFNGRKVIDGSLNNATFQVGANAGTNQTISFDIASALGAELSYVGTNIEGGKSVTGADVSGAGPLAAGAITVNGTDIETTTTGSAKDIAAAINTAAGGDTPVATAQNIQTINFSEISLDETPAVIAANTVDDGDEGSGAVAAAQAQQTMDLSATTVGAGETMEFTVAGESVLYTNTAGTNKSGSDLVTDIATKFNTRDVGGTAGEYTFAVGGSSTELSISQVVGNESAITTEFEALNNTTVSEPEGVITQAFVATGSAAVAEEQTIDFNKTTLMDGATMRLTVGGNDYAYTNSTGGDLTGTDLVTELAGAFDGNDVGSGVYNFAANGDDTAVLDVTQAAGNESSIGLIATTNSSTPVLNPSATATDIVDGVTNTGAVMEMDFTDISLADGDSIDFTFNYAGGGSDTYTYTNDNAGATLSGAALLSDIEADLLAIPEYTFTQDGTTLDVVQQAGFFEEIASFEVTSGTRGLDVTVPGDITDDVGAAFAAGVTGETETVDLSGLADLAAGESLTLTIAGEDVTYTNTSGGALTMANMVTDIDSGTLANGTLATDGGGSIQAGGIFQASDGRQYTLTDDTGGVLNIKEADGGTAAGFDTTAVFRSDMSTETTITSAGATGGAEFQSIDMADTIVEDGGTLTFTIDGVDVDYTNESGGNLSGADLVDDIEDYFTTNPVTITGGTSGIDGIDYTFTQNDPGTDTRLDITQTADRTTNIAQITTKDNVLTAAATPSGVEIQDGSEVVAGGGTATAQVQELEFATTTLEAGETITFNIDGEDVVYTNNEATAVSGADLVTDIATAFGTRDVGGVAGEYTFSQEGGALDTQLTITQAAGNESSIALIDTDNSSDYSAVIEATIAVEGNVAVPGVGIVAEQQSFDFTGQSVAAGRSVDFTLGGQTVSYTNETTGTLTGDALVTNIAAQMTTTDFEGDVGEYEFGADGVNLTITQDAGNESDIGDITVTSQGTVDGSYAFELNGTTVDVTAMSADATITATEVAAAINGAGVTGLTATANDDGTIEISSADGDSFSLAQTVTDATSGTGLEGVSSDTADPTEYNGQIVINSDADVALGGAGLAASGLSEVGNATTTIDNVSVATREKAWIAIESVDAALSDIDTIRGGLGAVQNRFESTIANLNNVGENLSAARSRILDADIATETSAMTKNNILQQAGVSILAQANQAPQLALSLLG